MNKWTRLVMTLGLVAVGLAAGAISGSTWLWWLASIVSVAAVAALILTWNRGGELEPVLKEIGEWFARRWGWLKDSPWQNLNGKLFVVSLLVSAIAIDLLLAAAFYGCVAGLEMLLAKWGLALPEVVRASLWILFALWCAKGIRPVKSDTLTFPTFFTWRIGITVGEGLYLLPPPPIGGFSHTIKYKKFPMKTKLKLLTIDDLDLEVEISIQFTPDRSRAMIFVQSQDAICVALDEVVKGTMNEIGQKHSGMEFRTNLESLKLLLNCALRLSREPHRDPLGIIGPRLKSDDPRLASLKSEEILAKDRLKFYSDWSGVIKDILDEETKKPQDRSKVEEDFGIDIVMVVISDNDFTEAYKKALERKRDAAAEMEAVKIEREADEATLAKLVDKKVDPTMAAIFVREDRGKTTSVEARHFSVSSDVKELLALGIQAIAGRNKL